MLAVSPLRNNNNERDEKQMEGNDYSDFEGCDFLDSIDFDDFFINMGDDEHGGVLPELEMDPEILAEFSVTSSAEEDNNSGFNNNNASSALSPDEDIHNSTANNNINNVISSPPAATVVAGKKGGELGLELKRVREKDEKGRKSAEQSAKNPSCKKKAKVDWTPELHRRFVQAVEQLGVDKAVPSRILDLMGIDCLTRHNIASHLQKYRSHRKHLLAREATAANWSHRRQMYGSGGGKREAWIAATPSPPPPPPPPIMGFPPPPPPVVAPMTRPPLHVWGHPPMDHHHHHLLHMWPKHPPPHAWPSPPPHRPFPPALVDPSFWMSQHQHRFPSPPVVPGIPPPPPPAAMYRPEITGKIQPQVHPSKESLDEAIGHVLSKPWMPLPLGLKPPSVEGVISELQRQGISNIPPAAANLINSTTYH